jgi:hypothetical protein
MAEYLVHFSNVLMLVSYSVRDILWLRWFAVERRPVVLSDDEQRLYELGFRSLRPREFVQGLVNRDLAGKVERLAHSTIGPQSPRP